MTLIGLLIALIVVVVVLWAVRTLLPLLGLPAPIRTVVEVVIVLIVVLYLVGQLSPGWVGFRLQ